MTIRIITIIIIFLTMISMAFGQWTCTADGAGMRSEEEDAFNEFVIEFKQQGLHNNTEVLCIPVVFNIINDPSFPLSRIQDQLDRTDQHLRKTNIDTIHIREPFIPHATDCHIELRLATVDEDGIAFNGVKHIEVPGFTLQMSSAVIAANISDPTRYLNVWVFPDMLTASGIFPWSASNTYDGIMMGPQFVGYELGGNDPDNQGGKIFTHEVGHFLGLYHTFSSDPSLEPGECEDLFCETTGDRCCDTPFDYRIFPIPSKFECALDPIFCLAGDPVITNDENYMFYNLDRCQNMFTRDQRSRMRAALYSLRGSLTTAETHASTGIYCGTVGLSKDQAPHQVIRSYPNPASDLFNLDLFGINGGHLELNITDRTGRVVLQQKATSPLEQIDISSLSPGMYHVTLHVDGRTFHSKIIKQ